MKDGRHKNTLPKPFLDMYLESMDDPQLLELRDEIALLDLRINELTAKVKEGENDQMWSKIRTLWSKFMFAVTIGDVAEQNKLLSPLNNAITNGASERLAWNDIASLVDRRRKLVETESRRLIAAQHMITVEQAMMILTMTIGSLQEAVYLYADQTTARHILTDAKRRYDQILSLSGPIQTIDGSMGETPPKQGTPLQAVPREI